MVKHQVTQMYMYMQQIKPVPVLDSSGHCSTPYSAVTNTTDNEIEIDEDMEEQRKIENDVLEAVL